jgi:hypothetical protein
LSAYGCGEQVHPHIDVVLASGVLLLLAIALSNSSQLVLSHEPDDAPEPPDE